jgi:hypothetical protein
MRESTSTIPLESLSRKQAATKSSPKPITAMISAFARIPSDDDLCESLVE